MIDKVLRDKLIEQMEQLSPNLQRRVADFAAALAQSAPTGTPGGDLLRFAGTVPPEDAKEIVAAIEMGCEQVDADEW